MKSVHNKICRSCIIVVVKLLIIHQMSKLINLRIVKYLPYFSQMNSKNLMNFPSNMEKYFETVPDLLAKIRSDHYYSEGEDNSIPPFPSFMP